MTLLVRQSILISEIFMFLNRFLIVPSCTTIKLKKHITILKIKLIATKIINKTGFTVSDGDFLETEKLLVC
jgi:hypothetical protein